MSTVCDGDVCKAVDRDAGSAPSDPVPTEIPANGLVSLLGDTLLSKDAQMSTTDLTAKYVGIYFSAHWCPPCRGFTPQLVKFYEHFQKTRPSELDIVFVSSDRASEDFDKYYALMPWKALPYDDRERKAVLSTKYKVSTIPSLMILDRETGELVSSTGRTAVVEDPQGARFPWRPATLESLLQGPVLNAAGDSKTLAEIAQGKVTALYFSAHWCPPCRKFTPTLVELYKKLQGTSKEFEVVFVSSDRDAGQYREYLAEMPWWAIPLEAKDRLRGLSDFFNIEGIPSLIILNEGAAKVITTQGISHVGEDPDGLDFPWPRQPVEKLTHAAVDRLNSGEACFIYAHNNLTAAGVQKAEDLLIDAALPEFEKDDPEIVFYIANAADDLPQRLLSMVGLQGAALPQLLILKLPHFAIPAAPQSPADVLSAVDALKSGKLQMSVLA